MLWTIYYSKAAQGNLSCNSTEFSVSNAQYLCETLISRKIDLALKIIVEILTLFYWELTCVEHIICVCVLFLKFHLVIFPSYYRLGKLIHRVYMIALVYKSKTHECAAPPACVLVTVVEHCLPESWFTQKE